MRIIPKLHLRCYCYYVRGIHALHVVYVLCTRSQLPPQYANQSICDSLDSHGYNKVMRFYFYRNQMSTSNADCGTRRLLHCSISTDGKFCRIISKILFVIICQYNSIVESLLTQTLSLYGKRTYYMAFVPLN